MTEVRESTTYRHTARLTREYENKTNQKVYRGPFANAAARQIFLGSPVA